MYVQLYIGIFAHLFTKSLILLYWKFFILMLSLRNLFLYIDALANFRIYIGNPKKSLSQCCCQVLVLTIKICSMLIWDYRNHYLLVRTGFCNLDFSFLWKFLISFKLVTLYTCCWPGTTSLIMNYKMIGDHISYCQYKLYLNLKKCDN